MGWGKDPVGLGRAWDADCLWCAACVSTISGWPSPAQKHLWVWSSFVPTVGLLYLPWCGAAKQGPRDMHRFLAQIVVWAVASSCHQWLVLLLMWSPYKHQWYVLWPCLDTASCLRLGYQVSTNLRLSHTHTHTHTHNYIYISAYIYILHLLHCRQIFYCLIHLLDLPAVQVMWVWSLGWEDPGGMEWQPAPVFLMWKSHGQRSLGLQPWGHRLRCVWAQHKHTNNTLR